MTSTVSRERSWVGVLFFGIGAALIAGVITASLQPNGFGQGFFMGFLGGILIADGLAIIMRTSRGSTR